MLVILALILSIGTPAPSATIVDSTYEVMEVFAYLDYKQTKACASCPKCPTCSVGKIDVIRYSSWVVRECQKYSIDPLVVAIQIWMESKMEAGVIRKEGTDTGLMQVVPRYAKKLGYTQQDLLDPQENIECGVYALHLWKKSKKYGKYWLDHNAYGVILPMHASRQGKIFRQVAWWRKKMAKSPWYKIRRLVQHLGDGPLLAWNEE